MSKGKRNKRKTVRREIDVDSEPAEFAVWLDEFKNLAVASGMPARLVQLYHAAYRGDALEHFDAGLTPSEAVARELMG